MSHALASLFGPVSHRHQSLTHKRQLELFHEVLDCHRYIERSYPSWEEAFPENVVRIDINAVETSPLFIISIGVEKITDEAMIRDIRECSSMTAKGLGLRGDDPKEVAFLNDCWNEILTKALSFRRRVPVPA